MNDAERVDVGELWPDASRYVEMVKAGRRVPVTEEGKVIGYLVPAEESGSAYERLVAAGRVRPAVGNLLDLMPPPPAEPGEPLLSEIVAQMRDEEDY